MNMHSRFRLQSSGHIRCLSTRRPCSHNETLGFVMGSRYVSTAVIAPSCFTTRMSFGFGCAALADPATMRAITAIKSARIRTPGS